MTPPKAIEPPRIAAWLVELFTAPAHSESILGDLQEELLQVASESGAAKARSWYWRQAVQTVVHLAGGAFRAAPWAMVSAIAAGFLLRRLLSSLPEQAIFAVLHRYQVFDHHFGVYRFFASTGIDIGHILVFWFVGCIVALLARGREMTATTLLALVFAGMSAFALAWVAAHGDAWFLWRGPWVFADSLAIVIGGAIVRMGRSRTRQRANRH